MFSHDLHITLFYKYLFYKCLFFRNDFVNIVQEKEEEEGGGEGLMLCSRITAEVRGNATVIKNRGQTINQISPSSTISLKYEMNKVLILPWPLFPYLYSK